MVPAAGVGRRVGGELPKQYRRIAGKTVIEHSVGALLACRYVTRVVVAVSGADAHWTELPLARDERVDVCEGGAERVLSVIFALERLAEQAPADEWVLVHDAVRPCLDPTDVEHLVEQLATDDVGGLLAVPARDTLKHAAGGRVLHTLDRGSVWQALTPQMFRIGALRSALRHAINERVTVTDEASAVESTGRKPRLIAGRHDNIKITWPEDLAVAEDILRRRQAAGENQTTNQT